MHDGFTCRKIPAHNTVLLSPTIISHLVVSLPPTDRGSSLRYDLLIRNQYATILYSQNGYQRSKVHQRRHTTDHSHRNDDGTKNGNGGGGGGSFVSSPRERDKRASA